jgi:hypothetical protein
MFTAKRGFPSRFNQIERYVNGGHREKLDVSAHVSRDGLDLRSSGLLGKCLPINGTLSQEVLPAVSAYRELATSRISSCVARGGLIDRR